MSIRRIVFAIITAIAITAALPAAATAITGVPARCALLFHLSIPGAASSAFARIAGNIVESGPVRKLATEIYDKIGYDAGAEFVKNASSMRSMTAFFTASPSGSGDYLLFSVQARFASEATAEAVIRTALDSFTGGGQDGAMKFAESRTGEVTIFSAIENGRADDQLKIIKRGPTVGIVYFNSSDEALIAKETEALCASFATPAQSVASIKKYGDLLSVPDKDVSFITYFSEDFIKAIAAGNKKSGDVDDFIESGIFAARLASDFTAASALGRISFLRPPAEATDAVEIYDAIAALASPPEKAVPDPGRLLSSDAVALVSLRLNLGEAFWKLPRFKDQRNAPVMNMMTLGDDILSWFDGSIFLAAGDCAPDIAAIRAMRFDGCEFFAGFGSRDRRRAERFLDKLRLLVINMASVKIDTVDETVAGARMIRFELPESAAKGLSVCAGVCGDFLLVTAGQKAFEKAAKRAAEPRERDRTGEGALVPSGAGSFVSVYSNLSRITNLVDVLSWFSSDASLARAFMFIERSMLRLDFSDGATGFSYEVRFAASRFSPEALVRAVKRIGEALFK